jgi:hypothetical protein
MNKTRLIVTFVIAIIIAATANFYIQHHYAPLENVPAQEFPKTLPDPKITTPSPTPQTGTSTSKTLLLKVPFTPQAPTGNWDKIHNEDCEEASAIMANAYFYGPHDAKLDPSYVESLLTKLTDWEQTTFGYNLDINSQETVLMIEANFSLHAKIVTDYTESSLKNELSQNHLVLIPENGQLIGNPNYKQPGPPYHMLVIRGFTASKLITNDPGTRNGLNYEYSFTTLFNANGTWDHATNSVDLNKKNIIVVTK